MAKIAPIDIEEGVGLGRQVKKAFIDLTQHLLNLNFMDNFKGLQWEGVIPASTEVKIPHRLKRVPSGYVVTFCQGGTIQAGSTPWTTEFVYLTNISAVTAATGRVFFFV